MAGQPGIYTVIGDIIIDQACSVLHLQSCKLITSVRSVTAASLQQTAVIKQLQDGHRSSEALSCDEFGSPRGSP